MFFTQKNILVKVGGNDRYVYLSIQNQTTCVVKMKSGFILKQFHPVSL